LISYLQAVQIVYLLSFLKKDSVKYIKRIRFSLALKTGNFLTAGR